MDITSISASSTLGHQAYVPVSPTRASAQKASAPALDASPNVERQAKEPSLSALQQAIDATNKVLESKTSDELHFAIDKGTGLSVVKLINRQSGETILQFPSEAMLQIARSIDQLTGAIIERKV